MRSGLIAAIGVAAMIGLIGPAPAQDEQPQAFIVHGVAPDGTAYDGLGDIKQVFNTDASGDAFAVTWIISGKQMKGMAVTASGKEDTLAVSFDGPDASRGS